MRKLRVNIYWRMDNLFLAIWILSPWLLLLKEFKLHLTFCSKLIHWFNTGVFQVLNSIKISIVQVDPRKYETKLIEHALEKMYFSKDLCYEPAEWLKDQYTNNQPWSPSISLNNGFYVRKIHITPCKAYFRGPEITVSNHGSVIFIDISITFCVFHLLTRS